MVEYLANSREPGKLNFIAPPPSEWKGSLCSWNNKYVTRMPTGRGMEVRRIVQFMRIN
jgi:hypothetical protein